ncbi:hypothetical protein [Streptomyces sp. NPDC090445]|uniref:hypothetical protein n=1 Tax=Streptomyces sp. NPDC090445 TaxID=3365963 RepID=UPI0037F45359
MIETIGAVTGVVVSIGSLALAVFGFRHQIVRARLLDAREQRLEAAERQLEQRRVAAERQAVLTQASMVDVRLVWTPSRLNEGVKLPELKITNDSTQPILDLAARLGDEPIAGIAGGVAAGDSRSFPVTSAAAVGFAAGSADMSVIFTDAAGMRWRRDPGGGLREGRRLADGSWAWASRESPSVERAMERPSPSMPPPLPASWVATAAEPSRKQGWFLVSALGLIIGAVVVWLVFLR